MAYPAGMTDLRTVYVTAPDEDVAAGIASTLLRDGLVACANVLPGGRSLYVWEGDVVDAREAVMLLKTRADRVAEVVEAVGRLHPYDVPCVLTWPIDAGADAYLDWVRDACAP